ncbi:MAG: signal recognition particle receptor subunit alpha, partial [Terracidiphilus sp.]
MMLSRFFSKEKPEPSAEEEPKTSFLDRMKQAVSRTRETFSQKINDIAALTRTVDESDLDELESVLLTSDLGVQTTTAILDALRERARRQA